MIKFCKEPNFVMKGIFVNQNHAKLNFTPIAFAQTQVTTLIDRLWDNSVRRIFSFRVTYRSGQRGLANALLPVICM